MIMSSYDLNALRRKNEKHKKQSEVKNMPKETMMMKCIETMKGKNEITKLMRKQRKSQENHKNS